MHLGGSRRELLLLGFSFCSCEGGGDEGLGGGDTFIVLGDSKGKWKSELLLGSEGLPLSAAAPVLPRSFPNKVRAGKVAVIVQPRFHRFLLRRGGAGALHAPRRRAASSCRRRGSRRLFPPPPPAADALGPPGAPCSHPLPSPPSQVCGRQEAQCPATVPAPRRRHLSTSPARPPVPRRTTGSTSAAAPQRPGGLPRPGPAPPCPAPPGPAPPGAAAGAPAGSPGPGDARRGGRAGACVCAARGWRVFRAEAELGPSAQAVAAGLGKKKEKP